MPAKAANMRRQDSPTIHSIGHSNHPIERFIELLARHGIACLVDVRSYPGSRWAPQFGRHRLAAALGGAGIDYVWLGRALGGKRDDPALLTADGKPDYDKIAARPDFAEGLEALIARLYARPTAMMCAEEDPARCHRTHLVGAALVARGVGVRHIRRDGRVEESGAPAQGMLFD